MVFPVTQFLLRQAVQQSLDTLDVVGQQVVLTGQVVRSFRKAGWWRLTSEQAAAIGWPILWMGLLMSTCFGMVIALQVAKEMVKQGAGQFVGTLVAMAVVRELGPLMTGFSAIAIAGSAFTSELLTMRLTQQMDALHMMRVSAIRYLALPRVLAAVITLPLINILVVSAGILGGFIVALKYVTPHVYFDGVWQQTKLLDLAYSEIKAVVFGLLLAIIAVHTGLSGRGTSADMVSLTTKSVVRGFVAMAIFDYIITAIVY
jgi:phospholipid/cholesterol/gamma-HCH transport system permease protein